MEEEEEEKEEEEGEEEEGEESAVESWSHGVVEFCFV